MGEISVKTGNNARNGGKNSLNRLIRCVCGKKIGPDPRNFNQRVSLGRNDLLIRTFLSEADALTRSQREQSIALLAKTMGLPAPVIASYLDHRPPTTIKPVNAEVAALQQQTADLFYENRLVPKKVDIRQRIWQPTQLEGKQL
ncbi:hypothetical protein EI062_04185 [Escherichia coli]|nr:hypothetical protein [Escherichia coli]